MGGIPNLRCHAHSAFVAVGYYGEVSCAWGSMGVPGAARANPVLTNMRLTFLSPEESKGK